MQIETTLTEESLWESSMIIKGDLEGGKENILSALKKTFEKETI